MFHCLLLLSLYLLTILDSPASFCFKVSITSSMVELFSSCLVCTLLFLNNLLVAFISLLDLFSCLYWVKQFMSSSSNFVYSQCCIRQMVCHMFVVNINIVRCMCYVLYTFYSWHFVLWDLVFIVQIRWALYHFKLPWMPWSGQLAAIYNHTVKAILYVGEWMNFFQKSSPIYCPLWVKFSMRSAHKAVKYFWVSQKLWQGRLKYSYWHKWNLRVHVYHETM